MRIRGPLLALLLVLASALPLAPGAAAQAATPLLEDPSGDVAVRAGDQAPTSPLPTQAVDLRSLAVAESEDDFRFTLGVGGFGQTGDPAVFSDYAIQFRHNDQTFRVVLFQFHAADSDGFFARLDQFDPGSAAWVPVTQVPVEADVAGGTVTPAVPRSLLKDTSGAAPFPGRVLDGFYVEARGMRTFSDGFSVNGVSLGEVAFTDRMPDSGEGAAVHAVVEGLVQSGHARLTADLPFRASNGEATTFVFQVNATSHADDADTFRLTAVGAPPNWEVSLPGGVRLGPHETLQVPVVVRTPFAHAHGSSVSFVVEMESQADPASVGRVELGVYYPSIPQPAGHHDVLALRSRHWTDDQVATALRTALGTAFGVDALRTAYMNAATSDETDQQVPVGGDACSSEVANSTVVTTYCWQIPLEPGLLMGLDFDLSRTGELTFPVQSVLPMPNARLSGALVHLGPGEGGQFRFDGDRPRTVLATVGPSQPVEVAANGDGLFTVPVVPTPEGDLVPFQEGAALRLELQVAFDRPDNPVFGPRVPPEMAPGGTLRLPLLEYEDPVDESFEAGGLLVLEPVSEQERRVNAGRTVLFAARLVNNGPAEDGFRLSVSGPNAEWARLVGDEVVRLAPGASATVQVAVAAPEGAADGDKADLVLQAESRTDVNLQALLRFKAVVDSSQPIPDESPDTQDGGKKGAPAPPALLVLAALAALALAARRRSRTP